MIYQLAHGRMSGRDAEAWLISTKYERSRWENGSITARFRWGDLQDVTLASRGWRLRKSRGLAKVDDSKLIGRIPPIRNEGKGVSVFRDRIIVPMYTKN